MASIHPALFAKRTRQPQTCLAEMHRKMTANIKLAEVIKKYGRHPEYLGLEITDVNQPGAMDDTSGARKPRPAMDPET